MAKLLVLFAHPALEKSRVHAALIKGIREIPGVTFHDLYEAYPDFDVDVPREQQLLLDHDYIILQHPFYWYSAPALVKQWMDLVLEHNWAYGSRGKQLAGKVMLNVLSAGGGRDAYSAEGRNRFSIRQFLAPFDQTAVLCSMEYWPPFVVHGTHRLSAADTAPYVARYHQLLGLLSRDEVPKAGWKDFAYLNELFTAGQPV